MSRILLLHASVGTGHRSAAYALADAFTRRQASDVRVEDTLDYGSQLFRQAYARSYIDVTSRAPTLWRIFYEGTDITDPDWIEVTNRLRSLVERLGVTKLERLVRRFAPAAIICTHFLPVELLLRLKNQGLLPQPVYCVVTDFFAHTFWLTSGIDSYFVGSDLTRDLMVARGVPAGLIRVSGIPVGINVAEPKPMQAMRQQHDLPVGTPLVTLFGGGIDVERVRGVVTGLLRANLHATLVVVAGRNEALASALADLRDSARTRLRVLSYIDYVDDLVAASDLVITKAGGLIVSEVLARGAPLLLLDPIPGQEEWNADYVVGSGAGVQLRMIDAVPRTVQQLLDDSTWLGMLRARSAALGRPRAALEIAEQVLDDLRVGRYR